MKLSVIIVNYNVKHLLEQCLASVYKAIHNIDAEIIVVDNHSADGSCSMLKEKFPAVKLIENKTNSGFASANNIAITKSTGEFVLLLNPDTLVEESTFDKCLQFANEHPDMGALGVKMINGKGKFLPESKRALPSPMVAFYKTFGLSRLFPRSKVFGKYHLGHLSNHETQKVDILCGAFMFIRREALTHTGLLDETFFMYGEDIDLSYRLILAGYQNYYYPHTTIVHYKGESTRKSSVNYVVQFYKAMIIFARKHYSPGKLRWFSFFIYLAIYFRAMLALLRRFFIRAILPLADITVLYLGFYFIVPLWGKYWFHSASHYPPEFMMYIVPAYLLLWFISLLYSGAYDRPITFRTMFVGLAWGTIAIILFYALIPESIRFSRALIFIGFTWSVLTLPLLRIFFMSIGLQKNGYTSKLKKKIIIVGNPDRIEETVKLIEDNYQFYEIIGYVSPDSEARLSPLHLGDINQLSEIIAINIPDEVIFDAPSFSTNQIIAMMLTYASHNIEFRIAPGKGNIILGSNAGHHTSDLYLLSVNSLAKPVNRRRKRTIDFLLSFNLLLFSPVLFPFFHNKRKLLKNLLQILLGQYSFVGYSTNFTGTSNVKGVLFPSDLFKNEKKPEEINSRLNTAYAKNYSVLNELYIIFRGFRKLDRSV